MELSDQDILTRLNNFEDPFTERKVESDIKDILKTAVAFANSLPIGSPGIIFVPVKDDGTIQEDKDLDKLQKTITKKMNAAYPPIPNMYKIINSNNKQAIAVIIWGSDQRPHFSGPSYVRRGSESMKASEEQFQNLIDQRQSKTYEIHKWIDREVIIESRYNTGGSVSSSVKEGTLINCNNFYLTIKTKKGELNSYPLNRVTISFDHIKNTLKLEINPGNA